MAVAKGWRCGLGGIAALGFGLTHIISPSGIAGAAVTGGLSLVMGWGFIARVPRPWTAQICWGLLALRALGQMALATGLLPETMTKGLALLSQGILAYMAVTLAWGRAWAVSGGALVTLGVSLFAGEPWARGSQALWFGGLALWMSRPAWVALRRHPPSPPTFLEY